MDISSRTSDSFYTRYGLVPSYGLVCIVSLVVTGCCIVASFALLVSAVPRRAEGIRRVPDVSWQFYASISSFAPLILAIVTLGLLFRTSRQRVVSWVTALVICYLSHEFFHGELLHRDFIGKF